MEEFSLTEHLNIFYITADSFPAGVQKAFNTLEILIGGKYNRSFFGLSKPENKVIMYRAGVLEAYPGEAEQFNCQTLILKKGTYLTETVDNFMQNMPAIALRFKSF